MLNIDCEEFSIKDDVTSIIRYRTLSKLLLHDNIKDGD